MKTMASFLLGMTSLANTLFASETSVSCKDWQSNEVVSYTVSNTGVLFIINASQLDDNPYSKTIDAFAKQLGLEGRYVLKEVHVGFPSALCVIAANYAQDGVRCSIDATPEPGTATIRLTTTTGGSYDAMIYRRHFGAAASVDITKDTRTYADGAKQSGHGLVGNLGAFFRKNPADAAAPFNAELNKFASLTCAQK